MTSARRSLNVPRAASHFILLAAGLAGVLAAPPAKAACPPGYRSKGAQCIPGPVEPHRPYTAHSNVPSSAAAVHPAHKPGVITEEIDRRKVKPQPGAPIERAGR